MMKYVFAICRYFVAAIVLSAAFYVSAGEDKSYAIDGANSSVSFASIKKQYVVEPATFSKIDGSISEDGMAYISVDISSVDTAVPIRNERLQQLFFNTDKYPTIEISANVGDALDEVKTYVRTTIAIDVELYGTKKTYDADVMLIKSYRKKLVVASMKPIIISQKAHNIPDNNLVELAKTVGAIPISGTVPVNFVVSFVKK